MFLLLEGNEKKCCVGYGHISVGRETEIILFAA
jgi:hypothetical protein